MPNEADSVLIVEDDPEINELLGAYAQICGFVYRAALNGGEAFDQVSRGVPSLIILDVMLPDMNGFDICQRLKGSEQTRGVPVIMLTALDTADCRQRGMQCGASEYLTKPFDPDRLMRAMREYGHVGEEETQMPKPE